MPAVFGFDGTVEPGVSWQTNFVAITGNETVWPPGTVMRDADVADDHSQTIRFSEYDGPSIHWMEPRDLELSTMTLVVNDKRGISSQYLDPAVAMVDGSVRRLNSDLTPEMLRAMCTAAGGESETNPGMAAEMQDGRFRPKKP